MITTRHLRVDVAANILCTYAYEFPFQMWKGEMQENMDYKKHGDAAFRSKDFDTAIEFYTEVKTKSYKRWNHQET